MADTKISALPAATLPLAGTEVLPIVQGGVTEKVAVDDLTVKNVRSTATSGILQITGPGAGTTRVATVPNANWTAARTDAAQSFTGDQTLSTGNLVIGTSGKGIDFSATPGTGTSELLADYEEGTWTPVYQTTGGSFTYSIQTGTYTKIGNVVYCSFRISTATVTAGTGQVLLAGLPFTQNGSGNVRGSFGVGDSRAFLGDTPTGIVTELIGTTTASLTYRLSANGGITNLDASDLAPTGAFLNIIAGSFFYTV